ncbi:MAG: hypothetical protein GY795_01060 [Desulfobacterales bacterium]|nr:hypothetical protein [Desulfobacterales bacterium]
MKAAAFNALRSMDEPEAVQTLATSNQQLSYKHLEYRTSQQCANLAEILY